MCATQATQGLTGVQGLEHVKTLGRDTTWKSQKVITSLYILLFIVHGDYGRALCSWG